MGWTYRARLRNSGVDVVEVYEDKDGVSWSDGSVTPTADTKFELIQKLEKMLNDIKENPTFHAS